MGNRLSVSFVRDSRRVHPAFDSEAVSWILAPVIGALLLVCLHPIEACAQTYALRVTEANRMGVTLTNYGFVGNNFVNRSPSMEYPLGTGYEHLTHGGLWVGALAIDDTSAFLGVTTACVDINVGLVSPSLTEFTPISNQFITLSTLPTSPYYSPDAVSEEDNIAIFGDATPRQVGSEPHRPMQLIVRQTSHAWTVPGYSDILFLEFVITNNGPPLRDVRVGLYTELASGPKNAYSTWPPSSGGSYLGSWFNKKLLAYDASLQMIREHRCAGYPIPDGCQFYVTPAWVGVKLLTPPALNQAVTLAAWSYSPGNPLRDQDAERYAIMGAGTIQNLNTPDLMPVTGDPVELLVLGPFPAVDHGDSLRVDFALVGGAEVADIQTNAGNAQALYDAGYRIDIVPVLVSLAEATARPDGVTLAWRLAPSLTGARVYRRESNEEEWRMIAEPSVDGAGFLRYADRAVVAGRRYGYRLGVRSGSGGERFMGETWMDVPGAPAFGLARAGENPASRGSVALVFSLPDGSPAKLALTDATGRRVYEREVGAFGGGRHMLALDALVRLSPGVYFAHLEQGTRRATTKLVVLR